MAIQTVAAVKTELRNRYGMSIIAPRSKPSMTGNGGASPTDPRGPVLPSFPPCATITPCHTPHRRPQRLPPARRPNPGSGTCSAGPLGRSSVTNVTCSSTPSAWDHAGVGSFLSVFMVRLGATDFQVGLLTAMPALTGMLLAMPAGEFLSRQRHIVPWFARSASSCSSATCSPAWRRFVPNRTPQAIILIWALATLPQRWFRWVSPW